MTSTAAPTSIKNSLIKGILLICGLSLFGSLSVATWLDIKAQQHRLISQLYTYAEIISFNASTSLLADDAEMENNRLRSFGGEAMLLTIHLYRMDPERQQLNFFSSYNGPDVYPYVPQLERVTQLHEPQISNGVIELAKPIIQEGKVLGYVYLRGGLQQFFGYVQQRIMIDVAIFLGTLLLAWFTSRRLQRRVTAPLESLLSVVQKITKEKSYNHRLPLTDAVEIQLLSRAINNMLGKIENQINKLKEAEQENRNLNQQLEQKINERTLALKSSNQDLLNTLATLHQYQNQIVETEKMASLGQMVAGIAHEVNTPIGLGVTASTLMQDRLAEVHKAFEEKKLTASQLAKFLNDSHENLSIIYRNLERAANLIRSFKQVAVDQSNENQREFNVLQLIDEVLLSLRPNLKKTKHQILIHCEPHLNIDSKPGPINQVLINLVMNSLIHAFDQIEQGQIDIWIKAESNRCFIHYKDNGCGVPEQIKKRIFDPFVTTKRGEGGSGLGMHLVYNLVTQALGGKIVLDSELGKGIDIFIDFPITLASQQLQYQPSMTP